MNYINTKLKRFALYACITIPLEKTTKNKLEFIKWFLQSFVLALSGFWLPFVLSYIYNDLDLLESIIYFAPFTVFSITFLSQKLVLNFSELKINSNNYAATARAIVSIATILLILLQVCIWTIFLMNHRSVSFLTQVIILLITLFLGIILYGMQGSDWEDYLSNVLEKQNEDIDNLGKKADGKKTDKEGNKL